MSHKAAKTKGDRAQAFRTEALDAGLICATTPTVSHHRLPLDHGELLTTSGGSVAVRTLVEMAARQAETANEGEHTDLLELTVDNRDLQQWLGKLSTQLKWQAQPGGANSNTPDGEPGIGKKKLGEHPRTSLKNWLDGEGQTPEI